MSMEQVRSQRAYLDAADLEREADDNIERLEGELARWRKIRQTAQNLGSAALEDATENQVIDQSQPPTTSE